MPRSLPGPVPLVDLASRLLGSGVVAANDESFGEKENLVVDAEPHFVPGTYGHKGEVVDGWETRRRRDEPGADWALVRLGGPGVVREVDVDTRNFTGNYPARAWVEGTAVDGYPDPAELERADWWTLVPSAALKGDDHNVFAVDDPRRCTHLRLWIEPDGGVARLRVRGHVTADPAHLEGLTVDLAARELGGVVVAASDESYTSAASVNLPGRARTMGEGWMTRRLRGEGHDWLVVALAAQGELQSLEVDTTYYVVNASRHVVVRGCAIGADEPLPDGDDPAWRVVLDRTRLQPDTRHVFRVGPTGPLTHLRLDAFPDGGLSRLRAFGRVTDAGLADVRRRWEHGES